MNTTYKTAIKRNKISAPMQYLSQNNLLVGTMLDYGCGKGFDANYFKMFQYDTHYHPYMPVCLFDTITCNYVLNVIESDIEINTILYIIKSKLKINGIAYITVRSDIVQAGPTSRGYQRDVQLGLQVVCRKGFTMYKLTKES